MKPVEIAFACGFRVFFASCALYAIALMAAWIGVFAFDWSIAGVRPVAWHAHEMIYGMTAAAIAGFLLTAVPNWTRTGPVHGAALAALWLLWAAGRAGYWLGDPAGNGWIAWLVVLADLMFLPALAWVVARPIITTDNRRNLVMVGLLAALFATNLLHHSDQWTVRANTLALDLIMIMMIVIAGRITPLFTRNWLRRQDMDDSGVRSFAWLEYATIGLALAVVLLAQLGVPLRLTGSMAIAAGLAHAARLCGWQGWRAWRDPLVWVLHVGYAWIIAALVLRGIGHIDGSIPVNAWMHALGAGAIATLILGVMSRVTLGHTGRPLKMPRTGSLVFALITVAALARTGSAAGWIARDPALLVAGVAWIGAFAHFALLFFGKLFSPRVDGQPG